MCQKDIGALEGPADSKRTSTRSQFGELIWRAFFGEPIEITALEADSIPWIPQIILPTDTQQTPSRLPTDLNQVLIWRAFFGEPIEITALEAGT